MHASRSVRRTVAAILVGGASLVVPSALDAACVDQLINSPEHGWVQQITCCGDTACCTTQWKGSTLVAQQCR